MSEALVECVPNFSEGRDEQKIRQITDAIQSVDHVTLLDVDAGRDTNRTVVTFAGPPEAVVEAAFRAIQKAKEVIDMRKHQGAHPRMGATDVCPLVPISGITMEETVRWAHVLAQRVGSELAIPVYLYEAAQPNPARKSLSDIRSGEYEGFFEKIKRPEWKPDYGPGELPPSCGATVIGARNFLVAYNVNLNTTSVRRANAVAFDVREAGRKIKNERGEVVAQPGMLKAVKAIGWYLKEYGIAQVSMNLTDLSVTPVHAAFEACVRCAESRGLRVTGSELVGLIPLQAMLDAGKYFLTKQKRSAGVSEEELIRIAIRSLGLNELAPFDPQKKIIEYRLGRRQWGPLASTSLRQYIEETASESPAPGGGSAAACMGALAAALATMVANLTAHKKEYEQQWQFFSDIAERGQNLKKQLLELVDADTEAFLRIMQCYSMPKQSEHDMTLRQEAIQRATRQAIEVPLRVMQASVQALDLLELVITHGNPQSISDAAVGVVAAGAAVSGARFNVLINLNGLSDPSERNDYARQAENLQVLARDKEKVLLNNVQQVLARHDQSPTA